MNSSLSIEEIVLINSLFYAEDLGGPMGTFLSPSHESKTIGDYIKWVIRNFDQIDDNREYSSGVPGSEYKQIITAADRNTHLKNIIIMEVHIEGANAGGGRSALLFDPSCNEAIVGFKGTEGDAEWIDNFAGLYKVPTAYQQNALNWFKSLDLSGYDVITVTGHSKGGNKSKFITLMDERVDNCFSFDGQGFSDEFIKTYSDNIKKSSDKILNIIAQSDFVNILLNDIGKKKFFLGTNYGRLGFVENHCANAILFFDDKGEAMCWAAQKQDQKMVDIDSMLNSFVRSLPIKKKIGVAKMLGSIILNASKKDTEGILSVFSDKKYSKSAADLLAFILRYKKEKPQIVAYLKSILSQNGFDTDMFGVIDFVTNHELVMELIAENPSSIIRILRLNNAPKELINFLENHRQLFSFIGLVATKMRSVNPTRYSGDDMTPDTDEKSFDTGANAAFSDKSKLAIMAALGMAGVTILAAAVIDSLTKKPER